MLGAASICPGPNKSLQVFRDLVMRDTKGRPGAQNDGFILSAQMLGDIARASRWEVFAVFPRRGGVLMSGVFVPYWWVVGVGARAGY